MSHCDREEGDTVIERRVRCPTVIIERRVRCPIREEGEMRTEGG